jgi:TonB family protein
MSSAQGNDCARILCCPSGFDLNVATRQAIDPFAVMRDIRIRRAKAQPATKTMPAAAIRILCEGEQRQADDLLPLYPKALRKKGLSGSATVSFVVTPDSKVSDPVVAEATEPAFGEAAVQAIREWWFSPKVVNGRCVASRASFPFKFAPPVKQPAVCQRVIPPWQAGRRRLRHALPPRRLSARSRAPEHHLAGDDPAGFFGDRPALAILPAVMDRSAYNPASCHPPTAPRQQHICLQKQTVEQRRQILAGPAIPGVSFRHKLGCHPDSAYNPCRHEKVPWSKNPRLPHPGVCRWNL